MLEFMRRPDFDFTRKAVVGSSGPSLGSLVLAQEMRPTVIRGGLHAADYSDGTSLVVLPQQFSHCLEPRDPIVLLIRVDFLLTGMIFFQQRRHRHSVRLRHFSPACRRRDLADVRALGMTISEVSTPMAAASGTLDWQRLWRKIRAIAASIR
jgi:hypothetical protein